MDPMGTTWFPTRTVQCWALVHRRTPGLDNLTKGHRSGVECEDGRSVSTCQEDLVIFLNKKDSPITKEIDLNHKRTSTMKKIDLETMFLSMKILDLPIRKKVVTYQKNDFDLTVDKINGTERETNLI